MAKSLSDLESWTKEELIVLVTQIRESVSYSEDAGDTVLYIAELLGVSDTLRV